MLVKCELNDLRSLREDSVRSRLEESIHLDSLQEYFTVGQTFKVQAIEYMRNGVWIYIHTSEDFTYPHPFPAEFFSIEDNSVPGNWCIKWIQEEGAIKIKRLSFREWVEDDTFYERLIDGNPQAVEVYLNQLNK